MSLNKITYKINTCFPILDNNNIEKLSKGLRKEFKLDLSAFNLLDLRVIENLIILIDSVDNMTDIELLLYIPTKEVEIERKCLEYKIKEPIHFRVSFFRLIDLTIYY